MRTGLAIGRLIRRVGDLDRASAFYGAIGFAPLGTPETVAPDLAAALGIGRGALALPLAIGRQRLDLVADCAAPLPAPAPATNDPAFQHLAIPVRSMADAMARLADLSPEPISRGGAETLPASSGGVSAFKFRDTDGHALELIHFPSGDEADRWAGAPGLFLGIDHTAVTVSDIGAAIGFFADELGFRLASRGLNRGPEQARLDGLPEPVVDVLALVPPGGETPHLELLHYREPAFRREETPETPATWTILTRPHASRGIATRLAAPDGHGVIVETK